MIRVLDDLDVVLVSGGNTCLDSDCYLCICRNRDASFSVNANTIKGCLSSCCNGNPSGWWKYTLTNYPLEGTCS